MNNTRLKRNEYSFEIKFSFDFGKIISLMFVASPLVDAILQSL
ncbi:hypothetical protein [Bacillus toyonensis]|nr:hypothetical protein [Bacillus toyonensis]